MPPNLRLTAFNTCAPSAYAIAYGALFILLCSHVIYSYLTVLQINRILSFQPRCAVTKLFDLYNSVALTEGVAAYLRVSY